VEIPHLLEKCLAHLSMFGPAKAGHYGPDEISSS
jgi:hypothetical protein